MESTENLEIVPPESRFRKSKNPPLPPPEKKAAKAVRLTPGAGTFAAIRNRIKMPKVKSNFFRISCERHKKRQADCFFSGMLRFLYIKRLSDQIHTATGLFNFGFGASSNAMSVYFQGNIYFTTTKNHNRISRVAQ